MEHSERAEFPCHKCSVDRKSRNPRLKFCWTPLDWKSIGITCSGQLGAVTRRIDMDILRAMINQDSLREVEHMSQRLNGILKGRSTPRDDREEAMALADWIPMVDVVETEGEFLLHAELPGVDKKDVKLSIERGVLTVSGQRDQAKEDKGRRYHRVERAYGR